MPSPAEPAIILGADGFLGRHLVRYFAAQGWPVHPVGRGGGDLADRDTTLRLLAAAPRAGRIFHLATRQRTGPVQYGIQGELLAVNASIHLNVLEAWRLHQPQAKLISAGSSCAYPELPTPIPETAFQTGKLHPSVRGYGLAKQLLAEGSAVYGEQYGLCWLHCVLATVYGPFDHKEPERAHFMTALIARAVPGWRAGEWHFEVWGSPENRRDLLYVDDQIEAILAADRAFSDTILNVSANRPVSIGAAAAAIRDCLGWQAEIVHPPGSFNGAAFKSIDAGRFLAQTGWRPRFSLADGIRAVLAIEYGIKPTEPNCTG
ncbi:MAG TPA: NAD-dependent epimerase/dehydratase family protein [Stellaceae bacterium]|nr:NAD-dependent epimerase/dehydratase family protein [Stellaceae bacterium]